MPQDDTSSRRRGLPSRTLLVLGVILCAIAVRSIAFDKMTFNSTALNFANDQDGDDDEAVISGSQDVALNEEVIEEIIEETFGEESGPRRHPGEFKIPLETLTTAAAAAAATTTTTTTTTNTNATNCPEGRVWFNNNIIDEGSLEASKIPRYIHQAAPTRCIPSNYPNWRNQGFSYFLHDQKAQDVLLQQDWPEFPHLRSVVECLKPSRQALADIWKYLVLWEYGGLVLDWDMEITILPRQDKDAVLILLRSLRRVSNSYVATSPRHPLVFFALHNALHNVMELRNMWWINQTDWNQVTGGDPFREGFKSFFRDTGVRHEPKRYNSGNFEGRFNRSLTLLKAKRLHVAKNVPEEWKKLLFGEDTLKSRPEYNMTCLSFAYDFHIGPPEDS